MTSGPADALFFESPVEFRAWLDEHAATATELWVGFHRRASGRPTMTWAQSVDEALCVGWIDGRRQSIDDADWAIRFTPRRPGSNWSAVNVRRVPELLEERRMRPAGLAGLRGPGSLQKTPYSYERRHDPARPGLRGPPPRQRRGMGVVLGPVTLLPPRRQPLDHEREARRDAGTPPRSADR